MKFDLSNPAEFDDAIKFVHHSFSQDKMLEIKVIKHQRTLTQNRALHLMFTQLSEELNDHGLYINKVLKPAVEVQWTPELVKEYMWRSVQKIVTGKQSSSDLTTKEIDQVFELLHKHLAEKLGITVEFPSIESLIIRSNNG